jgi:hypothetical protein
MGTPAEFRRNARECVELAGTVPSPSTRPRHVLGIPVMLLNNHLSAPPRRIAEQGDMQAVLGLNNLVRRDGPTLSRRINYTSQPTSRPGQNWIQIMQR